MAKAGWRSPLESLAQGNIRGVWERLPLTQQRAILDAVCDITVVRGQRGQDART